MGMTGVCAAEASTGDDESTLLLCLGLESLLSRASGAVGIAVVSSSSDSERGRVVPLCIKSARTLSDGVLLAA